MLLNGLINLEYLIGNNKILIALIIFQILELCPIINELRGRGLTFRGAGQNVVWGQGVSHPAGLERVTSSLAYQGVRDGGAALYLRLYF